MKATMDLTLGTPVLRLELNDGPAPYQASVASLSVTSDAGNVYGHLSEEDVVFIIRSLSLFAPEAYREAIQDIPMEGA